jgi:hypothetical protein
MTDETYGQTLWNDPNREGKWLGSRGFYVCSACGESVAICDSRKPRPCFGRDLREKTKTNYNQ